MTQADTSRWTFTKALLAGFGASLVAAIVIGMALRHGSPEPGGPAERPIARTPATSGKSRKVEPRTPEAARPGPEQAVRGEPAPPDLEQIIRGNAPLPEKFAALKTASRAGVGGSRQVFEYALTNESAAAEVRSVAIRYLLKDAATDAAARGLLEQYAKAHASGDPERGQALDAVLRFGTEAELGRCSEMLFAERDAEAVGAAARALLANPSGTAQSLLTDLGARHPDSSARHRAEEERTQDYCEEHRPVAEEE
ncbi:MAG: hypothetical protein HYY18_17665 [Planctomycetes bacterium]|nr:hypothetical protein [Planctomycetota bacterium]